MIDPVGISTGYRILRKSFKNGKAWARVPNSKDRVAVEWVYRSDLTGRTLWFDLDSECYFDSDWVWVAA